MKPSIPTHLKVPHSSHHFGRARRCRLLLLALSAASFVSVTPAAESQDGGLPALEARFTALEALVATLQTEKSNLQAQVTTLQTQVTSLQTQLTVVKTTVAPMKRIGDDIIFESCNVHIRSGSGKTDGPLNGLGNLIIGYSELISAVNRSGSHNLVVGRGHGYSSWGGFVAGENNKVTGPAASVSGGNSNTASASYAVVNGGFANVASAVISTVSGGYFNNATADAATVSGGCFNWATELYATVSGGYSNKASGAAATVSGGALHQAAGLDNWVGGSYSSSQ